MALGSAGERYPSQAHHVRPIYIRCLLLSGKWWPGEHIVCYSDEVIRDIHGQELVGPSCKDGRVMHKGRRREIRNSKNRMQENANWKNDSRNLQRETDYSRKWSQWEQRIRQYDSGCRFFSQKIQHSVPIKVGKNRKNSTQSVIRETIFHFLDEYAPRFGKSALSEWKSDQGE